MDGWYGYTIGDRKACLWGAEQDYSGKPSLGMRLRNVMYQRSIMLPSAPLDEEVLENHLQRLDKWQPTFLQAFPSPLYEFCLYLKAKNRRLPYLRGVSVTAEPLYIHHRALIEEVLGFKIFNWYGSRELGRVASECEYHDGLHINEPSVHVEVEQDPSLPDGFGHLIITDLWNRATPFIRYQTGDIARIVEGECSCGRALKRVATIEGRLTDMVVLPGGRKITGIVMASRLATDSSEIIERQVVQKDLRDFHIRYVKGPKFKVSSLDSLKENFCKLVDSEVSIIFEEVSEIPRERSGKIRFVKCEIAGSGGLISASAGDQREETHV
jgi:phenylacetate-CoA ligase